MESRNEALEKQIKENFKFTDHSIREYPISVIVDKFTDGLEDDCAELYIPDYQREFIWSDDQQSRFIESLLLNLPVPYLFVSDTNKDNDGRLEIVDGSQRIRTLVSFLNDELTLKNLKKLDTANGFKFSELSKPRQIRFKRITLRMIELTEKADEEARREMFDRLNSGGTNLNSMEVRKGTSSSLLYKFIYDISPIYRNRNTLEQETELAKKLRKLCPISISYEKRQEYAELLVRYFAYSDNYLNFKHKVDDFLNDYGDKFIEEEKLNEEIKEKMIAQLNSMLDFVGNYFPCGFLKAKNHFSTPRIRFESIAVGITLALREQPSLQGNIEEISQWLESKEFKAHTRSDASNSKPKVKARIEYVRDKLLNRGQ